jgi:N-acetylglutamate synthase-like GNAT family acetyltransferase
MDDFQSLKSLWKSMRLPANELKKRLTEFQLIETAGGQIVGAIGVEIIGQHGLLHSEGYTDFSVADAARELFWERIQTIAAHHGVFRLWTQENSPFWIRWGFQPANAETLARLPEEWKSSDEKWLTFQRVFRKSFRESMILLAKRGFSVAVHFSASSSNSN